jgi:hypothetical protein
VNRFRIRSSAVTSRLAVCGLVAAVALTGCSAGQQSQTSVQEPAVNGTSATVNTIALRDVLIQAVQTSDALRPGQNVDLVFAAVNQSPDVSDTLIGLTSEIGTVTVSGNTTIPAAGTLFAGTPDVQQTVSALKAVEAADAATATVALTKPISNGLTYSFTFNFARAGQTTLAVPVSAGVGAPRQEQGAAAQPGGHP